MNPTGMGWCKGYRQEKQGTRPLSELNPGEKGRVAQVCCRGPLGKRLLEMGLTYGTPIEVVRHAPLGDPVEIKVRGYLLSLRKSEAEHVWISDL
ncbi:MAG: ferrous iron transport protein A [Armatimonadetes bacterium]|nr:ferrous iron transport protein A [Armatimonadota bacterium]